jgi:predicted small lipoprotein YifL
MPRWWPALVLGGWIVALAGCGDPPPQPLTPDEEKQFEQERQKERQHEKRPAD